MAMRERESSGDVPPGWGHPDDGGRTRKGLTGQQIAIGVVVAVLVILLIVALALLAVVLANYSSTKCLGTASYYIEVLDHDAVWNDSFVAGYPGYDANVAYYEKALEASTNANFQVYRVQVNSFRDATTTSTASNFLQRVRADAATQGVYIFVTVTIEEPQGSFPAQATLGDKIDEQIGPKNMSVVHSDTNPTNACQWMEPFEPTTAMTGGTGGSTATQGDQTTQCPTAEPCTCPTEPPIVPTRPTISGPTTTSTLAPTTTTTLPPPPSNDTCVDIMFILDESEVLEPPSIWDVGWGQLKQFMIDVASQYTVGLDRTRFSVVGFSTTPKTQIEFSQSTSFQDLVRLINNITLLSDDRVHEGARNTVEGFKEAYRAFTMPTLRNVPRYAIFIPAYADDQHLEDQDPYGEVAMAAAELRAIDVYLYIAQIAYKNDVNYTAEIDATYSEYAKFEPVMVSLYQNLSGYGNLSTITLKDDLHANVVAHSQCFVPQRCVADIVLVIDESSTVTAPAFYGPVKEFLSQAADRFDISQDRSHMAMVKFCNLAQTGIVFNFSSNVNFIDGKIMKDVYGTGATYLETALNITYDTVFTAAAGARPPSYNMSRIVIIITDGVATDPTGPGCPSGPGCIPTVMKLIHDEQVTMFAVGVGPDLTPEYLQMLTGLSTQQNVFSVSDFDALLDSLDDILNRTDCAGQQTTTSAPMSTTTAGTTLPPAQCYNITDIVLVVEDSSNADQGDVAQLKTFLIDIVEQFIVGDNYVRIALQLFNDESSVIFSLEDSSHHDTAWVVDQIRNLEFQLGPNDALAGKALDHTYYHVLTTEKGDRSCFPDNVILVSYSHEYASHRDDANRGVIAARKLRTAGAAVQVVGVGPNADPQFLNDVALTSVYPRRYTYAGAFSDLNDPNYGYADKLSSYACDYLPDTLFPCDMPSVKADIVFVVDTSTAFTANLADDVIAFITKYLRPYQFNTDGVQAALVIYSSYSNTSIALGSSTSYSAFIQQVTSVLTNVMRGQGTNIYDALNRVATEVLTPAGGYRPNIDHLVMVLSAECFTGQDPAPAVQRLHDIEMTSIYVVTLGVKYLSYRELLEIAGDGQHISIVRGPYIDYEIKYSLAEEAWLWLCPNNCEFTPPTCPPCGSTTTETAPTTTSSSTTTSSTTPSTTTSTTTATSTPTSVSTSTTTTSTTETPTTTTTTETPTTTTTTTPTTSTSTTTTETPTTTTTTETTPTTSTSTTTTTTTPETTSSTTESTTTSTTTESTTPTTTSSTTTTTTPTTTSSTTTTTPTTSTSTTTTTTTTTMTTTTTAPPYVCLRCPADVVFLIDESSSITPFNFDTYVTPFMADLALGLNISQTQSHFGLVHFSDPGLTGVDYHLTNTYNMYDIANYIRTMPFMAGNTALYTALGLAYNDIYTSGQGARKPYGLPPEGTGTAAYIIIITDGIATDYQYGDAAQVAYDLSEEGVVIFAVGVGDLVTKDYLLSLTYDESRIYFVDDFPHLLAGDLIDEILNDTCCPINVTKPTATPPPAYCDSVELIFVLDESESVNQQNPDNFDSLKQFMINITNIFTINQYGNSRVAAVGYGRTAQIHFNLNDPTDIHDLRSRIELMPYLGGARNPADAFNLTLQNVIPLARPGVPIYVVHVAEYAHDVGMDPVPIAQQLGVDRVIIYEVPVLAFQNDEIFQLESSRIALGGYLPDSQVFNSSTYQALTKDTGLVDRFQQIFLQEFPCPTATTPFPPGTPAARKVVKKNEEKDMWRH